MSITELIAAIGGGGVIIVAIAGWISSLVAKRIIHNWEVSAKKETAALQYQLDKNKLFMETVLAATSGGQDLSQKRRLDSVERLWKTVVEYKNSLSAVTFFYGILMPSEYDEALVPKAGKPDILQSINEDLLLSALEITKNLYKERPFLGETLWFQFYIYQAFLGRLAFLLFNGKRNAHIADWRDDSGIKQFLGFILRPKEVQKILEDKNDFKAIDRVIEKLESDMLLEASMIVSGRRSALESFENAKDLRKAVEGLEEFMDSRSDFKI